MKNESLYRSRGAMRLRHNIKQYGSDLCCSFGSATLIIRDGGGRGIQYHYEYDYSLLS
jgi:hypothetical protein